VERATELANQMLALAKVEQMRQHRDAPVSDWAQTVRAVSLDLSALIADRNLDFQLDLPGRTPVRAHEWALREVTRNLLHNAIKHSPAGGTLQLSLHHEAGQAVLLVRDSGPGIAPTLRERLFQPFATDHGAGPSLAGSGLGLAICLGIVQSIDGNISLDNRVVEGAVLGLDATVRLPIEPST
jgi:two-component system, OmpR family, sensor histidine kinase TctE